MPHKFNADRRDKIAKQKYQVTNWPAYNESLRQRGDLTIWVKDEALSLWTARRRTSRGGQPKYSDLAITLCLTLRVVYGLALRQTQGLMRSVAALMGFDIAVPDFSTLSRRSKGLALPSTKSRATTSGPVHLVVDSTGLKVFGEGEWLENKHKTKAKRKRWRKLHLGLNLVSGEIVCSDLTVDDVGDPTALPGLLDQIGGPVEKFIADGAYDGTPSRDLLATRFGEIVEIIIPPPKTAVASPQSVLVPSVRDRHIAEIQTKGRMAWQKSTGYNKRSRAETQMGRWKAVIGPKLKARHFDNQKTEAKIGVRVLNRMTELGRPKFERVA
ncbi:IS5 family transposase [Rhizobium ruizarguesonis]|uniref:IS5 family transposase n=1 Tax=Rhizobium ruizarguesonis TaxID=2081791 RepID=UPI0013DEC275|nr:IS5 family transposase [Rhizobium ruizarguesonis]NEI82223.1 IS5 family transposase [Rhizobium ruizarguesonis]QSZ05595.1 IS5 family transposase [Rhizobium ruizarguesonis]QSZ05700.1 IS5 family transposase [Rhizobium ruizarguesonis]